MGFWEDVAADMTELFTANDTPAETVAYTPKGGSMKSIKAAVELLGEGDSYGQDGKTRNQRGLVHIKAADIANPGPEDTIVLTRGGETLTLRVAEIRHSNQAFHVLDVVQSQRKALVPEGQIHDRTGGERTARRT